MDGHIVLDYFNKLNEENAMFLEFKDGEHLLVDNNDIILVNGNLIEIENSTGCYVTESSNITGLKIMTRATIMSKALFEKFFEEGDD